MKKLWTVIVLSVAASWWWAAAANTTATAEEQELYQIAVDARNPEFCFALERPDYQMFCRVVIGDVGASCSQISSSRVRDYCNRHTTE